MVLMRTGLLILVSLALFAILGGLMVSSLIAPKLAAVVGFVWTVAMELWTSSISLLMFESVDSATMAPALL